MGLAFIPALIFLVLLGVSLSLNCIGASQTLTKVRYVEKITYACISGACYKTYGLRVNYSLTVYLEYNVNLIIPSPTGTVRASLIVNNTWFHKRVWLRLLGRGMIGTSSYGAGYYVDVTPQGFGYRNSTYLAVDPPIAIDFKPKPQEIKDGFFVAEVGEPYTKPKEGDFTAHHFELYYDPETQLFVGGKLHFVYMEIVHKDNYPIAWGVYDIHAEIYPASGRPPWIIVGKQTTTTTSPIITTSTTPPPPSGATVTVIQYKTLTMSTIKTVSVPQFTTVTQRTNCLPYTIASVVLTALFTTLLILCCKRRGH